MRATSSKPNRRHVSKLESLPLSQRQQLDTWLKEGVTYSEIVQRLQAKFGVKTASSSLSEYYSRDLSQPIGNSKVHSGNVSEEAIEFEIVTLVRIRRADLAALTA